MNITGIKILIYTHMQKVIFHSYKDINLNDVSQRQIYKQMNKLGLWKSYSIVQHKQKRLQKAAIFSFEVEFSWSSQRL